GPLHRRAEGRPGARRAAHRDDRFARGRLGTEVVHDIRLGEAAMIKKLSIAGALVVIVASALAVGFLAGRARPEAPAVAVRAPYHGPMHPQIVSDRPGHCPICQMTLVRSSDEPRADAAAVASPVPGLASVSLSEDERRLLGARTVTVELAPFTRTTR